MFSLITGIAVAIVVIRPFGVPIMTASILVVGAAWLAFVLMASKPRTKSMVVVAVLLSTLALYTGTFLAFRIFRTYEFSLAPLDDPRSNLVVFSMEPRAQEFARILYYPLIKIVPGHCYYPTRQEMEQLGPSEDRYGVDPIEMGDSP
jgi:hypothetical protein